MSMEKDLKEALPSEELNQEVFTAEDIEKIFGGVYVQSVLDEPKIKAQSSMQNQSVSSDNLS